MEQERLQATFLFRMDKYLSILVRPISFLKQKVDLDGQDYYDYINYNNPNDEDFYNTGNPYDVDPFERNYKEDYIDAKGKEIEAKDRRQVENKQKKKNAKLKKSGHDYSKKSHNKVAPWLGQGKSKQPGEFKLGVKRNRVTPMPSCVDTQLEEQKDDI